MEAPVEAPPPPPVPAFVPPPPPPVPAFVPPPPPPVPAVVPPPPPVAMEVPEEPKPEKPPPKLPYPGIIAKLTDECRGNVHEKGVIRVTASSCHCDEGEDLNSPGPYKPRNAVDFGTSSDFWSENEPNSWICYQLDKERQIAGYCIRSYGEEKGAAHLKSWIVEGSRDGATWYPIDKQTNSSVLNSRHAIWTCYIDPKGRQRFSHVRLRQTEKNHFGYEWLAISAFELYDPDSDWVKNEDRKRREAEAKKKEEEKKKE